MNEETIKETKEIPETEAEETAPLNEEEAPEEKPSVETEETEAEEPQSESEETAKEPSPEERIAELETQVAKLKNAYAMAYADTENTRKRLTKEYENNMKYHIQSFAMDILPVLDNCERALAHETTDETYRKGVEMIYGQLKMALEKEGVKEIEAEGQPFDANWHQALMTEHQDGVEAGMVLQVLQKGYKLKDRILRAAMVKVSE